MSFSVCSIIFHFGLKMTKHAVSAQNGVLLESTTPSPCVDMGCCLVLCKDGVQSRRGLVWTAMEDGNPTQQQSWLGHYW